jgi:hypothetical protein
MKSQRFSQSSRLINKVGPTICCDETLPLQTIAIGAAAAFVSQTLGKSLHIEGILNVRKSQAGDHSSYGCGIPEINVDLGILSENRLAPDLVAFRWPYSPLWINVALGSLEYEIERYRKQIESLRSALVVTIVFRPDGYQTAAGDLLPNAVNYLDVDALLNLIDKLLPKPVCTPGIKQVFKFKKC